jgi:magnesium-protoporphyrin IX monomethyl ester (oxidative) cyclase
MRRILLIQPPYNCAAHKTDLTPNPPLGLAYVAAVLDQCGFEVEILDAFVEGWDHESAASPGIVRVGLPFDAIRRIVAEKAPDAVGIAAMFTSQRKNVSAVAAVVKEIDPAVYVIVGGAHATAAPEMVLSDPNVDVAVLGEGEDVIVPLLQALENGEGLSSVYGVAYRSPDGSLITKERQNAIVDVNAIPFPARRLLPMEKYFSLPSRHGGMKVRTRPANIVASRGCPYRCNFCTAFKVFGRKARRRSVENILAELDELVNKYQVNELYFEDDQFLANLNHAERLLDAMVERRYDLSWDTPNGISPWLLNDRLLGKMKASGCYHVNMAVESGSQWVLDNLIRKPVRVKHIPELVRRIQHHGMTAGIFLVIGNIGKAGVETKEQIEESFRLLEKARPDTQHISILTPYPGSQVLEVALEKGYLVPEFDWDNLVIEKGNLQTPEWTSNELVEMRNKVLVRIAFASMLKHPQNMVQLVWKALRNDPLGFPVRTFRYGRKIFAAWLDTVRRLTGVRRQGKKFVKANR